MVGNSFHAQKTIKIFRKSVFSFKFDLIVVTFSGISNDGYHNIGGL